MTGEDGAVVVFNGEIYNHAELREYLAGKGRKFRSRSDTEVLLAAWEHWGESCLERLNGMFAFALWDPRRRVLFLARDRLGKKPLFFHHDGRFLAFASEPKALFCHDRIRAGRDIDLRSLSDFLSVGYVLGDKSIWSNLKSLPPAHGATFDAATGSLRSWQYWNLADFVLAPRRPYDQSAREHFMELLDDAVRLRLDADVPVGNFLSGGVDSSAVTAVTARISAHPPTAFTVGFAERSFDERTHARIVAHHVGVRLEELEVAPDRDTDLAALAWHLDEPFADTSALPCFHLNQAAARHVKVALAGDGADEVLAGYPTYKANRLYSVYRHMPAPLQAALDHTARRVLRPSYRKVSLDYKLRQFLAGRGLSAERAHYWWRVVFSNAEKHRLLSDDVLAALGDYDPFTVFADHFKEVRGGQFLDRCLYVDIKTWLANDILVKVDRTSMAWGLEVRSPFLDHRLVEWVLGLEASAKMRRGRQKCILKDSMADRLPASILNRRKEGFGAPTAGIGRVDPPESGRLAGLFRQNFRLSPAREDVTYKSFVLRMLAAWAEGAA